MAYHDIETAARNLAKCQDITVECMNTIQAMDVDFRNTFIEFTDALKAKLIENRRNKLPIRTGLDEVMVSLGFTWL